MRASLGFAASRAWVLIKLAAFIPPTLIVGAVSIEMYRSHLEPVETWFEPISLAIPDFCEGADPEVTYERVIHKRYRGRFHTAFELSGGDGFPICPFDSTEIPYSPKPARVSHPRLSAFAGALCPLPPGAYELHTEWSLHPPGYLAMHPDLKSNAFVVLPRDSMQCGKFGPLK
jgi:hypothetical protein